MQRIVTTSWDDGEQYDIKLVEILRARAIAATFYVPITPYQGRAALSHSELRGLSAEGFEIGAHSFSHKHLWKLSGDELSKEVSPCKPILEDILGKEVRMFCYPRGRYDSTVIRVLKDAGYWGARTVRMLSTRLEFEPFEMPTTLQVSPNPRSSYLKNIARAGNLEALPVCLANFSRLGNWLELGKRLFDSVLENGGVWHLYGHSQEIEELCLWAQLKEILDYVSRREGVTYVPNCELIRSCIPQSSLVGNGRS
jgi:peptidoglycan/xylan/chitin deacetylase (PgdA/CDA1 family)